MEMKLHTSDKDEVRAIRESMIHIGYLCGQSAHFGGGLSIVEILFIIYKYFLRITPESTGDPSREVLY
jgi:transketolase N-terminal domain/subunit